MAIFLHPYSKSFLCLNPFLYFTKNTSTTSTLPPVHPIGKIKTPQKSKFSVLITGSCGYLVVSTNSAISRNTHVSFCSKGESFDEFTHTHLDLVSKSAISRNTHVSFCTKSEGFDEFSNTYWGLEHKFERNEEVEELELLNRPYPKPVSNGSVVEVEAEPRKLDQDEVLEPFYKFFKPRDAVEQLSDSEELEESSEESENEEEDGKSGDVECYEPKSGDFVVGVVVSGNENKLDVNIGADVLGIMLRKEVLPLYDKEMDYLLCDIVKDAEEFMVQGKMGILKNEDAINGELVAGKPVVEPGTVLFAEILGRTLSGKPLLSTRQLFRRLAWHRVRQIKQLNEPIEVKIIEWNPNGLLARIEGLRAFLPKTDLVNKMNTFTELKDNVGRKIYVLITRINESTNDLIISQKEAWNMVHLKEGTLLDGTVKKIFPYGAQIRIGETNRSGLLHISNITRARVSSVSELLAADEKVKVLVVKSMFPDKISLSIADLESEPGLFTSDKERVFSEAEEMAKKYRQNLPKVSAARKLEVLTADTLFYEEEGKLYANWKWFKFERDNEPE